MLVVSDSSPFIGLVKIGCVELLPQMFGSVVIPTQVADELTDLARPQAVRELILSPPPWLLIRAPSRLESISGLDLGETAAISLTLELNADVLLIDEKAGRDAAIARNLRTLRTAALLYEAANAGVLKDLKDAYDKLLATNFRVNRKVLEELLARHMSDKQPS